jgi:hypothetical protein
MNKVEQYTSGKKRFIVIEMADGSVKELQLAKTTSITTDTCSGNSLYIEPNKDGTYRLLHGTDLFQNLDAIVSIKIKKEDFV